MPPKKHIKAPTAVHATGHATWRKVTDQFVHARRVHVAGLDIIELRDWNQSDQTYGRGVWLADSPMARDLLDRITYTPALPAYNPSVTTGPLILATITQAPGSVIHLRAIDVDGTTALEFREHRNGSDAGGYWIPYDAIAEQILHIAHAHDTLEEAA